MDQEKLPTRNIYAGITNAIAEAVERGAGEFKMPWHGNGDTSCPINVISKNPYRGVNVLQLWVTSEKRGYQSNEWGTFKQFHDKGGMVRKGEKATSIAFWKFPEEKAGDEQPEQDGPTDKLLRRVFARGYSVFNADQIEGYTPAPVKKLSEMERLMNAEDYFDAMGATIKHGGGRAFYSPKMDEIVMPKFEAFRDAKSYYAVEAHEFIHWTGHESRLDRGLKQIDTIEKRAEEELIAELGSAFLCGTLRLTNEPRKDHAQYVQSWLHALKNDPKAIFVAASRAQRANDFLNDKYVVKLNPGPDVDIMPEVRRAIAGGSSRHVIMPGM